MEVQGKIKIIRETQTYGTFRKREYVIVTDEQYPQTINLELHQDKCSLIDKYKVGEDIKTSINLRGKEWINPEGVAKYFNSIVGWRIELVETAPITAQAPAKQLEEVKDDLPF